MEGRGSRDRQDGLQSAAEDPEWSEVDMSRLTRNASLPGTSPYTERASTTPNLYGYCVFRGSIRRGTGSAGPAG
jgi:hypothetical protein